ncbi:stage II sporulation protein M [Phenylobacterium montanum]|uniref:Stage II sporulation protein M n=1 Tax=Phenylobacterium montanum TaxID=2823693 RepID=A0A975ISX8_9CAUL|nr:stage II sporulation protein M [Caulobacter sp. S6]QUD86193.1 stage II sporulation protein M [Caulobacter sp. S6]
MAELRLKSSRFRAEREADWKRLENLLNRAEGGAARVLSDEDLIAIPVLYRSALSSLSVARATSLDQSVVDYLESLCARAYFFVYGSRARLIERIGRFFAHDWPAAAKACWRETLASAALTAGGVAVGMSLCFADSDWFRAFVPDDLAAGRGPAASAQALRATLFLNPHDQHQIQPWLSTLATFLFTHNAHVALMAFAFGFALCLPSALLMAYQGCMLGAFLAVFITHGLGVEAGGWLVIHGVTEISAIILAGAAGMRIGSTLAFPGERGRLEAVAAAGRTAATLMGGVLVMLFCAGLLEGIGRQLIQTTWIRYTIAAATGVMWLTYLYGPRPRRNGAAHG